MFRNVLIGVDSRDCGRHAHALAHWLAQPDAEFTLVRVHRGRTGGPGIGYDALAEAEARSARALLWRAAAETGVAGTVAQPASSVAAGLAGCCREQHADLLVIGSSHHGGPGRLGLEAWVRQLLSGCNCPVAVAPRGYAGVSSPPAAITVLYDDSDAGRRGLAVARRIASAHDASLHVVAVPGADTPSSPAGRVPAGSAWLRGFARDAELTIVAAPTLEDLPVHGHPLIHPWLSGLGTPLLLVPVSAMLPAWGRHTPPERWSRRTPTRWFTRAT